MIQAIVIQEEHRRAIAWPAEREAWQDGVLWLDLQAPTQEEMETVAAQFDLSATVVRACLHPEHRAKIKEFRTHLMIVLNAVGRGVSPDDTRKEITRWRTLEVNLIVGDRFVITVHPESVPAITMLLQRYSKDGEGRAAVDYLVYTLLESVTSGYSVVLDQIDRQVDKVESLIFGGNPPANTVDQLFALKRHVLYLRRVLGPQRDAMGALMRREFPVFDRDSRPYFVDLYEHMLRLFDMLDTYRDLISSSLDAYLSTVSNRMNLIMKTLTIVSTIMLPLTVLTGIFGMNFDVMPLLHWQWGFWATSLGMVVLGLAMTAVFKWRGWM